MPESLAPAIAPSADQVAGVENIGGGEQGLTSVPGGGPAVASMEIMPAPSSSVPNGLAAAATHAIVPSSNQALHPNRPLPGPLRSHGTIAIDRSAENLKTSHLPTVRTRAELEEARQNVHIPPLKPLDTAATPFAIAAHAGPPVVGLGEAAATPGSTLPLAARSHHFQVGPQVYGRHY